MKTLKCETLLVSFSVECKQNNYKNSYCKHAQYSKNLGGRHKSAENSLRLAGASVGVR